MLAKTATRTDWWTDGRQGCYDPVSRPVPRDGIRDGTGRVFSKGFLKKPVIQKIFKNYEKLFLKFSSKHELSWKWKLFFSFSRQIVIHAVVKGNSAPYPSASPPHTSYPLLSRPVPFIPRGLVGAFEALLRLSEVTVAIQPNKHD